LGPSVELRDDGEGDRSFMICTLNIFQVIKSCCTCNGEERHIHGFGTGNLKEETTEDLGVSGRIIFDESARSGMGSMDWIGLAQDGDSW